MLIRTMDDLEQARKACRAMVTKRASVAAGTSALPLPGADIAADVAIMLELIPAINRQFGLSQDQIEGYDLATKQLVYQLIKRAGMALAGQAVTKTLVTRALTKVAGQTVARQALRFVPVVGWGINAAIGFGAMKYVGNSHIDDCFEVCKRLLDGRPGE